MKIGLEVWVTVHDFLGSEARRDKGSKACSDGVWQRAPRRDKASRACRDRDLESHFSVRLVPV